MGINKVESNFGVGRNTYILYLKNGSNAADVNYLFKKETKKTWRDERDTETQESIERKRKWICVALVYVPK